LGRSRREIGRFKLVAIMAVFEAATGRAIPARAFVATLEAWPLTLRVVTLRALNGLVDFEVVLATSLADIGDIGAHGFREYVRLSTDDLEPVRRQDLDHILLREREIR
jgi:hypothetical protein